MCLSLLKKANPRSSSTFEVELLSSFHNLVDGNLILFGDWVFLCILFHQSLLNLHL